MSDTRFLGICILVSSAIIGLSVATLGLMKPVGRFQLVSWGNAAIYMVDTTTGEMQQK